MTNADTTLFEYESAARAFGDVCAAGPECFHAPDTALFSSLRKRLIPLAEAGDSRAQYALGTIAWLGLCQATESEQQEHHGVDVAEASRWWTEGASRGHLGALDNLITSGVGLAAQRARAVCQHIERERPELVGHYGGMPVYGLPFIDAVRQHLYKRPDAA